MDRNRKPGIYLLTDTGKKIDLIGVMPDGKQQSLCGLSPIMELVNFVNFDFSAYRTCVERLWEKHAVFEERREVPYADYEDFARQALPLAERLVETAPTAYWDVLYYLDPATKMLYDGKPIFPSRKAFAVLNALRRPYFLQNRMRNLFEIGFADFERGTQQDRFRALEDTWPGLIDRAFSIRFLPQADAPSGQGREYALSDLYELLLAELSLYFQQDEQRIARCENCWRYFVPKTKAVSLYCYGEVGGVPCKEAGPNHMRQFRKDTDAAYADHARLRRRLEERANRLELAGPGASGGLLQFDRGQYDAWMDEAHKAKKDYRTGRISAPEFLKRIDPGGELDPRDTTQVSLPEPGRTLWREQIKRNIDFVPGQRFTDMLHLDLSSDTPSWTLISSGEQIRWARGGHTSLRDRCDKGSAADYQAHAEVMDNLFTPKGMGPDEQVVANFLHKAIQLTMSGELDELAKENGLHHYGEGKRQIEI